MIEDTEVFLYGIKFGEISTASRIKRSGGLGCLDGAVQENAGAEGWCTGRKQWLREQDGSAGLMVKKAVLAGVRRKKLLRQQHIGCKDPAALILQARN